MPLIAIIDAGPLVAWANAQDRHHERVVTALRDLQGEIIIPALCLAEASYVTSVRVGPAAEATLIRSLATIRIEAPTQADMVRMVEIMERYADFPLGAADASIVSLAERLNVDVLVTLDLRHFRAVRPNHVEAFRLLPD